MKAKQKKPKKRLALAVLYAILSFLMSSPHNVRAMDIIVCDGCSIDTEAVFEDIASQAEQRYGFDQDIWRRAKRKENAPRVEIFFDNSNPKVGEKITAHAVPEYFKNDPQNLYYTWYIIHTENGTTKTATNTMSDGKREASRIAAAGDYDPDLDGQDYADSDEDPDKDGWPAIDANSYDEDKVAAPMGGADGVGGLAEGNDNIEPYADSNEYCSSRGNHTPSGCNLYTEKSSFNQYYNLTPDQSGDFCTACQSSLAGNYDSTISPTGTPAGSVNDPQNDCCYAILYPGGAPAYDPAVDYCPTTYNSAYESCYDYADLQTYNLNKITQCLDSQYATCQTSWNNLHSNPADDEPVGKVSRCYKHNFGVNSGALGFRGYEGTPNSFSDDDSGTDVVTDCRHKWKDADNSCTADDCTSGSGKFPTGEERAWETDPTDPDTDGDGFPDEADVIGLGQESFTWTYQAGDRVGVVVEGTSMIPTDETNAYYKIMWGYMDVCDNTKTGLLDKDECEDSDDYGYGYLATKAPGEEAGQKIEVSLSFTPDSPIADPSDENKDNITDDGSITDADKISVISSIDSTSYNPRTLHYTWQISKSADLAANDWKEVTDLSGNFNLDSAANGLGLANFSFTPKKNVLLDSSDIIYFKVTLTVSTASDVKAGRGRSSVVVPVNKNGLRLAFYKVDILNGKATIGDEICTEGLYRSLCPVVKSQMLAARVTSKKYTSASSDFGWQLNGEAYNPPQDYATLFDGWDATTAFFPITQNEQETETISVAATPKDELAPVSGARLMTVVQPAVFIRSADTSVSWPETIVSEDPDKKYSFQRIESEDSFQALAGKSVSYYADFVPGYLLSDDPLNTLVDWKINGTNLADSNPDELADGFSDMSLENDNKTIKFLIGDFENQFYPLGVEITKYWSDDEKNILDSAWEITPETLRGETSATISTVAEAPSTDTIWGTTGIANPPQILAAIGTNLPHYVMYLLRLALTMLVMFFVSAVFYGISQRLNLGNEEK